MSIFDLMAVLVAPFVLLVAPFLLIMGAASVDESTQRIPSLETQRRRRARKAARKAFIRRALGKA